MAKFFPCGPLMGLLLAGLAWGRPALAQDRPVAPAPSSSEMQTVLSLVNEGRSSSTKVTASQLRLVHPADFPAVTLVGFFTGSRSVLLGSVVLKGKLVPPNRAAQLLLQQAGWGNASGLERAKLAQRWLEEGILAFGETLVKVKPKGEDAAKIHVPSIRALGDGGVRIIAWVEEDPGRSLGTYYRRCYYIFGAHGELSHAQVLDRIYIPPQ
jgi:hypothetical protein